MAEELTFVDDVAGQPQDGVSTESQDVQLSFGATEEEIAQQQERERVQNDIQQNFGDVGGAVLDKILRFGSGIDDIAAKALATPRNVAHWAASKIWEEDFDTPEERQRAAQALFEVQKSTALGGFLADIEEGARERVEKTQNLAIDDHGGKDFLELADEGNYLESADAFVGDVASALPSVVAAMTGAGGLAVIGGSAFSSKYEEAVDSDREISMDRIFLNSISSAGGEIASEMVTAGIAGGLGKLAKRVGPKAYKAVTRNMGTKLATSFGLEGSSEVAAEAWDKLGDLAILGDEKAFDGALRDFGKTFLIGGVIGSGITIPQLRDGQNASGGNPSGGGEQIARAVVDKITPADVKSALKTRGGELTALYGDYQTAKDEGADPAVIQAFRDEYDNRYEALEAAKDRIYEQAETLGPEQIEELNRLDDEINALEQAIDDPYADDVEASYNTTEVVRTQIEKKRKRQNRIFNTKHEASETSKKLSKKAQKEWEAGAAPRSVAENFQGRARQIAGRLWAGVPKGLRVGSYQDFVQGIISDHQGVTDLVKSYDPEKSDSLGAWVNSQIENRANRIIKTYTKQKFDSNIDDIGDVAYEPKKRRSAATIATQIQVPASAIDKVQAKVKEFAGKVKDYTNNADFVKAQEDAFKSIDLRKDIKGKNWNNWVTQNAEQLRQLALLSGKGWGRDWVGKVQKAEGKELSDLLNAAPTVQEFIDFATGKDGGRIDSRQNGIIKRVEAGLAELAWAEHVANNPELQTAINKVNDVKRSELMANMRKPAFADIDITAFQEFQEDGDAEAQGGSIQWIWKEVLGQKERLDRRSEATRKKFHNEALGAAKAGLLPPWVILGVSPASAGAKNGIPNRGGMYTDVNDPNLVELLEVAEANWKGPKFNPQRVPINELALTKVKQNKARQDENHRALEAFGHVLENIVDKHPTLAAILTHDAYKNTTGLIKIAAPLKYASKKFEHGRTGKQNSGHKYREEHAIPASIIGAYMLSSAKQKTWGKIFPHVKKNFVQMMLSKKDDQKFDDAKLADVMPKGWRITDNVLARYFNNHLIEVTGGIDPAGLYDVNTGQSVLEEFFSTDNTFENAQKKIENKNSEKAYKERALERLNDPEWIPWNLSVSEMVDIIKQEEGLSESKKLDAFDFDDTLYNTQSRTIVNKADGTQYHLTAEEFAKHKKAPDETYDFSEFNKVINPTPVQSIELLDQALERGDSDVVILTARHPKSEKAVREVLRKRYGYKADRIKFKGVGHSSGAAKANYLVNSVAKHGYEGVFFADDAIQNVEAVKDALETWEGTGIITTSDSDTAANYLVKIGMFDHIHDANKYVDSVNGFKVRNFVFNHPEVEVETPIHEFSHIWNQVVQHKSPVIFENLFYKIRTEAPALFDEQLQRLRDAGYKLEPESIEWKDEIMAGILGNHGNLRIVEAKAKAGKWSKLFNEFWDIVSNFLGINPSGKKIQDLNVEQVLDLIVDEVIQGKPGSNLYQLDKMGWREMSLKRRQSGIIAASLVNDPTYTALKNVKRTYEETGDLKKALEEGYKKAKKDFPNYDDFADIFKKVAKIRLRKGNPELFLAKAGIVHSTIKAKKAEIENKRSEGVRKKFRQILHKSKGLGAISRWVISPNAEDLGGLLEALLPKGGKAGVETRQQLEDLLINPYVEAIEDIEADSLYTTRAVKEFAKKHDFNKPVYRGYTLGDAILAEFARRNGKDTGITDQKTLDILQAAFDGANANDVVDFLGTIDASFNSDQFGKPLHRTIFTESNRSSRKKHLAVFNQNVKDIFTDETWKLVKEKNGETYMHALQSSLERMKSGRNRTSMDAESNTFNKWLGRAVGTTMFLNFRSSLLQLISTVNYASKPGMGFGSISGGWVGNMSETWAAAKELRDSAYMRARFKGEKFDLLADEIGNDPSRIDKVLKHGFILTKIGDVGAILIGGAPYYNARKKQIAKGKS